MANLALRVPATDQPTFFNKHAGVGSVLGGLAGYVLAARVFVANGGAAILYSTVSALGSTATPAAIDAAAASVAPILAPLMLPALVTLGASSVIGTAWGAMAGKRQMERELTEGVEVKSPSFWNKNIMAGMAITELVVTMVGSVIGLPLLPLIGASIAANVAGAVAGGIYGKQQMEARATQAHQLQMAVNERGVTHGLGLGLDRAPALSYQITPEEQSLLNAKLREGKAQAGHVAKLDEIAMTAGAANAAR